LGFPEEAGIIHRIISSTRFAVIIPVAGSFLAALTSFVYGAVRAVVVVLDLAEKGLDEKAAKGVSVSFIEVIDLFLIGTVFYIISLGLYELFVDDQLKLPDWLVIRSLDDLKSKLISGIIVIMGVYFLGALVDWHGDTDLLQVSGAISMVILALTVFQFVQSRGGGH
jgi:uncharacterized membrane protein YqhA